MSTSSITFLQRKQFKNLYGERIYAIAMNLERSFKKKTKIEEHIHFLQQCKRQSLVPRGMLLKNTTQLNKNKNLLRNTMFKLRNNTLQSKQRQLRVALVERVTQTSILDQYLRSAEPQRNHEYDLKWINRYDQGYKQHLIEKHDKKLEMLRKKQKQTENDQQPITTTSSKTRAHAQSNTSNVINLSKVNLSAAHLEVLSKGLKFVPTPKIHQHYH